MCAAQICQIHGPRNGGRAAAEVLTPAGNPSLVGLVRRNRVHESSYRISMTISAMPYRLAA